MNVEEAKTRLERSVAASQALEGLGGAEARARMLCSQAEKRASALHDKLLAERADVEALKELTFETLWAKLKGEHAERLEKEERELAVAKLALVDADEVAKTLRLELNELQAHRERLEAEAADYESAKEAYLSSRAAEGDKKARSELEKLEQLALLSDDERELAEASRAGEALGTLDGFLVGYLEGFWKPVPEATATEELIFGRGGYEAWIDTFGLLGGRNNISDHHRVVEKLNRANAQRAFLEFESEMADVSARLKAGGRKRLGVTIEQMQRRAGAIVKDDGDFDLRNALNMPDLLTETGSLLKFLREKVKQARRKLGK